MKPKPPWLEDRTMPTFTDAQGGNSHGALAHVDELPKSLDEHKKSIQSTLEANPNQARKFVGRAMPHPGIPNPHHESIPMEHFAVGRQVHGYHVNNTMQIMDHKGRTLYAKVGDDDVGSWTHHHNEAAAYNISRALGFRDMTTPTSVHVRPDGKLLTITDSIDDMDKGKIENIREQRDAHGLSPIERAFVFDSIIGNQDRHTGNYSYGKTLRLFDHGLSLQVDAPYRSSVVRPGYLKDSATHQANIPALRNFVNKIDMFNLIDSISNAPQHTKEAVMSRVLQLRRELANAAENATMGHLSDIHGRVVAAGLARLKRLKKSVASAWQSLYKPWQISSAASRESFRRAVDGDFNQTPKNGHELLHETVIPAMNHKQHQQVAAATQLALTNCDHIKKKVIDGQVHVFLHRGLHGKVDIAKENFGTLPVESWTATPDVARAYAGREGHVISAWIPLTSCVWADFLKPSRNQEDEIVVRHTQPTIKLEHVTQSRANLGPQDANRFSVIDADPQEIPEASPDSEHLEAVASAIRPLANALKPVVKQEVINHLKENEHYFRQAVPELYGSAK